MQDIARVVSESRRAKIIEEVRKSNLVDNVKIPLLYILAEREFVCVSMFSFTSPLFAAAITASWLRGADARVLLDRREARQRSSQFDNLERASQALAERYRPSSEFGVRTFSTTSQHLKNILLGSGVIIMGSQNLTTNAFVYNLEDICIITGDPENFAAKRGEFEETFARQGEVVPLPEAVASRHYIARSGVQGVRFLEGTPPPHEVERLFRAFSQLRAGDYRKLSNILEICAGMRAELVVDLERVFHPFSAQIRDPLIAHALLPAFLGEVPLGFCWAPASSTGRYHPGTTTSISGLIEHVFIVLELGIKLCRILGREDLVDQLILAGIAHDAYKNARRAEDGTVTWGPYNPEHGRLAAEEAWRRFASIDGWERSQGLMNAVYTAGAEHMTVWNKPVPTPLEAGDPLLKFILGLADMIASRKYMHLKHRVSLPLTADELMDIMLNNSFSIRGEGLMFLQRDADLFAFMRESAEAFGHPIAEYADVPRRAKKMLRIAESLCDLFQMKDAKDERRHDILAAALLYGTFRYGASHEIGAPQAARDFRTIMRSLRTIYPGDETRAGRVLSLMEAADGKLTRWDRARLTPQDDPALWIVCMANCMMTDPVTWVITDDEVRHYLGKAEVPQTAWARRRLNAAKQAELTEGVEALARREYLADILPHVQAGLLTRLNFRRREPLTGVHPEVMAALVEKYDSLFPSYIYEHFYKPLSSHHRKKAVERIRAANTSAEARAELIDYIRGREVPAAEPPSRVYGLMAQALLVNRVGSVEETVERVVAPVRDRESLRRYDYLPEIPKAVQHIAPKLASEEKILVYGDYDMDGQTGTAILVSTLRRLRQRALAETYMAEDMNQRDARKKAKQVAAETIGYYIPHRVTEGYGLNEGALERIHQRGYGLVITNDCGIRDRKLIARGKKMGIDFIVTDHHQPPAKRSLPKDAVAVINPRVNLPKDHPAYNLVGAGVAYKLALALADNAGLNLGDEFLDLVAVATIADVVQMSGENRAFVRFGLQPSARKNKGLAAVIRTQRLELIDEEAMAFFVAPLFNVLGRLGNAGEGTKLLLYGSAQAAKKIISSMLDSLEIRRETQAAILDAAKQMLSDYDSQTESGIAVAGEWHKGVIGLVASALVKEYGVPAVVIGAAAPSAFAAAEEPAYGSMRCIKGVSPLRILARCDRLYRQENGEPLFLGFGGHHVGAAGFKIEKSKISDFQRIYKEVCKAVVGKKREKIVVGATFQEGEITLEEVKLFRQLIGPFGSGFEDPLFYVPGKVRSWRVFGKDHQHVKGVLKGGTPFIIFYGNQRWIKRVLVENDGNVKMVVRLGMRSFRGKESVSLIVEDIKPRN